MSKHDPISDVPAPDAVRATLQRIVASDVFRSSPQLASFLSFVVESVLHGKSDRIKGYTIGVEVLRRNIKFDPQIDPIVRVEATRLRRALERYYSGPGLDEPVIISMPRGSYVPVFRHRSGILDDPDAPEVTGVTASRGFQIAAGVLVVIVVGAMTWMIGHDRKGAPVLSTDKPATAEQVRVDNGMPTLLVEHFDIVGVPDAHVISAATLLDKLRDTFSRFDAINIATGTSVPGAGSEYHLHGFIEYLDDGTTSVRFSLIDAGDGNVVWTRSFDRISNARDHAAVEDSITADVATTLLQPFGIIRSRERVKIFANDTGDPRYRCLLVASDAFRSFDPAEYHPARSCLERLTTLDPSFGDGFSYLASLYNREFVYAFGKGADDPRTLDRALQLARRGVEINPNSARAWQVLSTVLFSRHDNDGAFNAVQKALALNRYDQIIVGEYGGRLITSGEIDRGMAMLQRVASDGGVRPSWHHFYLFLGYYMLGKLSEATHEADEMTSDTYTHGLFARALTAALNGDKAKAQIMWDKLIALRSAWRDNPRGELEKYISAPFVVDRLMGDLSTTGLSAAK